MPTYAQRLWQRLKEIETLTDQLLDVSDIDYDPHKVERMSRELGVAILTVIPDCTWKGLDDEGRRRQRLALDRWMALFEEIQLLFSGDSEKVRNSLEKAGGRVKQWLDRSGRDFSVPRTVEEAKSKFREHVAPIFNLLSPFQLEGALIVVPDTNVFLRNQDIQSWAPTLGTEKFTVLLVPGVLAEMDEHKVNHRVETVRDKARRFSSRIKGWRNQGSLAEGVRVQGNIFVKVAAREPDFDKTLSWLDPAIVDDRILASILEYQRLNPMADVRLLSGDSVMLTKADEACIPTDDVPDQETKNPSQ